MAVLWLAVFPLLTLQSIAVYGEWNDLRVKFSKNRDDKYAFDKMPLDSDDAVKQGFEPLGDTKQCHGEFNGLRYIKDDDPAVVLLYDVNGYVAGIQTSIPENATENDPAALAWLKLSPMFTEEKLPLKTGEVTAYTLTAYLVDPDIICSSGRSSEEFKQYKGGENLYLKNGTEIIPIAKKQSDLLKDWSAGKCAEEMGLHFWDQVSKDMNCEYFQPIFLLYDDEMLKGFGWVIFVDYKSPRYEEQPPPEDFFNVAPECLKNVKAVKAQHIYMVDNPQSISCSKY